MGFALLQLMENSDGSLGILRVRGQWTTTHMMNKSTATEPKHGVTVKDPTDVLRHHIACSSGDVFPIKETLSTSWPVFNFGIVQSDARAYEQKSPVACRVAGVGGELHDLLIKRALKIERDSVALQSITRPGIPFTGMFS